MNKIGIVIKREYLTRVRKKSFIILTILTPLLFVGLIGGTICLARINEGDAKNIVVVDNTGEYFPVLKSNDQYHFIQSQGGFEDFRNNSDKTIYATLVISGDLLDNPAALTLYSRKQVVSGTISAITSQLDNYLSEKKLASYHIPNLKQMIDESKISVNMQTIRWDDSGKESKTSADLAMGIGMVFTILIYSFIFSYGAMVMQGVMEEKNNRIIELIVSSVKPFDLMMGKLIGIGLVGLTQFGIWGCLIASFSIVSMTVLAGSEGILGVFLPLLFSSNILEVCFYFIVFFIGGYLMYASLFAAVGAMVNSHEDTQQYMIPITVIILFALYAGIYSAQNPDGPLAFWSSLAPFTAPIVMMIRLPYGVPGWQLLLSVGLLALTVVGIMSLAAKIYRVGILMYGKKPTCREIVKWLKY